MKKCIVCLVLFLAGLGMVQAKTEYVDFGIVGRNQSEAREAAKEIDAWESRHPNMQIVSTCARVFNGITYGVYITYRPKTVQELEASSAPADK